jgi:hypothetical protein
MGVEDDEEEVLDVFAKLIQLGSHSQQIHHSRRRARRAALLPTQPLFPRQCRHVRLSPHRPHWRTMYLLGPLSTLLVLHYAFTPLALSTTSPRHRPFVPDDPNRRRLFPTGSPKKNKQSLERLSCERVARLV